MNTVALLAAAIAGAATLLLVVGIFGGSRSSALGRLARFGATTADEGANKPKDERRSVAQVVSGSTALARLNQTFERRTWSEEMARDLARADLALRPIEYVLIRVVVIVLFVAVGAGLGATLFPVLSQTLSLIIVAFIGFMVPRLYVSRRQAGRLQAFNSHLPDTITLIGNGLRSGASFLQAIELVVRESTPPISTEFNRVIREVNLGLPLEQALNSMVRRVRSDDLELMATAISIQHQVGGNLAEILDTISFTIRERVRIKAEIQTLTAMQRLSGYVVGLLPVGLFVVLLFIAPQFMSPMFERPPELFGLPVGVLLLGFGVTLMAIGFTFVRRVVEIDV
jgi:tight adherence protein B